jgi:hypothetical protein
VLSTKEGSECDLCFSTVVQFIFVALSISGRVRGGSAKKERSHYDMGTRAIVVLVRKDSHTMAM